MAVSFAKILNYGYLGAEWSRVAIRNLFSDKRVKLIALSALILNIIAWVAGIFLVNFLGDERAVLHYNVLFGIDLIGDPLRILIAPAVGFIIILTNLLLAASLSESRDRVLSAMFSLVALLVNIFIVISVYFIYLVNFS